MAEASDIPGLIYQNLIDAGCDQQVTDKCIALIFMDLQKSVLQVFFDFMRGMERIMA